MFGRVRIYNAGFAVFTAASVMLSFDPFTGAHGALWLIGWRFPQAIGGSMLTANSAAILTDAFPADQRGFALGTNQVAGLAGMFIGLVAGGILATVDWRLVFWVNVPVGIYGTVWAYLKLRELSPRPPQRQRSSIDWWGNVTFAIGLSAILVASTYGIQPYGGHTMGWTNPWVIAGLVGGTALLVAFVAVERRVKAPMINLDLFKIRAFTAGNIAGFSMSLARGGLQFMLVIWLQGIWLPLHGYSFSRTPLWAGIYMLPLTVGFLIAGPVSGTLSDRIGSRGLATAGAVISGLGFLGLMVLPVDFPYPVFALLLALIGAASGMFASPNSSSIMGSVPASERGVASGMRATFQNSGTAISIGIFFTLVITGVAGSLPGTLSTGLIHDGVPAAVAHQLAGLPPVSSLFGALLGINPLEHLLSSHGALHYLSEAGRRTLTGRAYFPHLISTPFHDGLVVAFATSAALCGVAAVASLLRGGRTAKAPPSDADQALNAPPLGAADKAQFPSTPEEPLDEHRSPRPDRSRQDRPAGHGLPERHLRTRRGR
jgi:MFS family permease